MFSNKISRAFCCALLFSVFSLTGCYSVFSGGATGRIVDAESEGPSKTGIANADIYAYTSSSDRNKDFKNWNGYERFSPSAEYFCHAVSGSDGRFALSKIIWKTDKSDFGKDADYSKIYLLFYHENYGLVKGETLIVSDSTSDTVYQEMTKIRKTTRLFINLNDVSTGRNSTSNMLVTVTVPQTTEEITAAPEKTYKANITGNGAVDISYPRWQNEENRISGIETNPEISISYIMASDEVTWKACHNGDNSEKNYAFFDSETDKVHKTISGDSSYSVNLYGKPVRLYMPVINGTLGDSSDAANDGIIISMKASLDGGSTFSLDCGETTTFADTVGTSSARVHGTFTGLGSGCYWEDSSYTDRFVNLEVKLFAAGVEKRTMTVRSNSDPYNVKL